MKLSVRSQSSSSTNSSLSLSIIVMTVIIAMKIIIKMTKGGSLGHLLCWWEAGRRLSTGYKNYFSSKIFALTTSDQQIWTGLGQAVRILRTTFAEQVSESPRPSSPPSPPPSPSSPSSSPSPSTPASPARWELTSTSSAVDHTLQLLWRDSEGPGCAGCRLQGGACPSHLRHSFGSLPRWLFVQLSFFDSCWLMK